MRYVIQHSKTMCIYSLDYALFCGMKKHILELAPFLNRCYWPGWITYSSILFSRIAWEFLPNSILTKPKIFHHFSSLCHTGSALQFIPVSVFWLWLFRGLINPFGFRLTLFCKWFPPHHLSMMIPLKKGLSGWHQGLQCFFSLISHIKCVHFASAKMFLSNCHCF